MGINRDTLRGWVKQAQIDAGSRLITNWRTAKSMTTDLVLDAREMGI